VGKIWDIMSANLGKNWDKIQTASISKKGNVFCRKHVRNVVRNLAELCPNHVRNTVRNFAEVCPKSFYNSSEQQQQQTFLGQILGHDLGQNLEQHFGQNLEHNFGQNLGQILGQNLGQIFG
jgi:hypothetical protein